MNQEVNSMTALGGVLIILGFISWALYQIAYITPLIFITGGVLLVAGIMSSGAK
jgi:membrane-bound ClpP family serine protease